MLLALALWTVPFLIVIVLLLIVRYSHEIPFDVYSDAARRWWAHEPLYDLRNIDGFQYFPQSAILFSPFAFLGSPLGVVLWRAPAWALFAHALWRLSRRSFPEAPEKAFLVATCLALGPSLASLSNGQANLPMTALALQAAVALIDRRWWIATLALTIGLGLKPLMLVPLALLAILHPPIRAKLALSVPALFIAPLVHGPSYALAQYRDCWTKLMMSGAPDRQFEDLRGLLWALGWDAAPSLMTALRVVATLAVLVAARRICTRLAEPHATLLLTGLAFNYLMLFNPRTQPNSFVMTASVGAVLGAGAFLEKRREATIALALAALGWSPGSRWEWVAHWLRPIMSLVFTAVLVSEIRRHLRHRILSAKM
jgi:hypothetical protein